MPIRHGDMFASRASTWPRDHFCRSTMAPRRSRPITWNEFLPISMPIVAMVAIDLLDMAVLRLTLAPSQHHSPVGQEHGRTIPLADVRLFGNSQVNDWAHLESATPRACVAPPSTGGWGSAWPAASYRACCWAAWALGDKDHRQAEQTHNVTG